MSDKHGHSCTDHDHANGKETATSRRGFLQAGVAAGAAVAAVGLAGSPAEAAGRGKYADPKKAALPPSDMVLDKKRTAVVVTDPQVDFLSPKGVVWKLVGKSVTGNNTVANIGRLMAAVFSIYDIWNKRVATGRLNQWLEQMVEAHPPPLSSSGRRVRLRYMTQVKARPPTFAVWTTRPQDLQDSYQRYLVNGLREDFALDGVPLRLTFRKGENPYAPAKSGARRTGKGGGKRGPKRAAKARTPKS